MIIYFNAIKRLHKGPYSFPGIGQIVYQKDEAATGVSGSGDVGSALKRRHMIVNTGRMMG